LPEWASLDIESLNADWIKFNVDPKTCLTARESELMLHDELAKGYAKLSAINAVMTVFVAIAARLSEKQV
jgi:hypothetical protein